MLLTLVLKPLEGSVTLEAVERALARAGPVAKRGIDLEVARSPLSPLLVKPVLARVAGKGIDRERASALELSAGADDEAGADAFLELAFSLGEALSLSVHEGAEGPPSARADLLEAARRGLEHARSERWRRRAGMAWGIAIVLVGAALVPFLAHLAFPIVAFGIAKVVGAAAGFPIDLRTFREMRRGR